MSFEIKHRYRRPSPSFSEPSSDDPFEYENEAEIESRDEDEDKENQPELFNWTAQQPSFVFNICNKHEKVQGMAVNCTHPLAFLQLFLTTGMMREFVNYTNEYAENYYNTSNISHNNIERDDSFNYSDFDDDESDNLSHSDSENQHQEKKEKHTKSWEETNENELWIFFSINIIMGIVKLPCTEDYWRKEFQIPIIVNHMARDRFRLLLKFFRVAPLSDTHPPILNSPCISTLSSHNNISSISIPVQNNNILPLQNRSNSPPPHSPPQTGASPSQVPLYNNNISIHSYTPLPHVNRLISLLNNNFGKYLTPGCQLAYDESMVDFQGYSTIRQYIKGKPHPWGYKILCLVYNKYVLAFEVYGGKRKPGDPPPSELGTVGDAVIGLVTKAMVAGFNHILFMDSWFVSPLLVLKLTTMGIRTCGAVKSSRKFLPKCPLIPSSKGTKEDPDSPLSKDKLKHMNAGDYFQYHSGNITYCVVKDKTIMKLLYNHIPGSCTIGREMVNKEVKQVPLALQHYCTYARGVDIVNQLHYNYIIGRKSKRCWPRLVWWLLELCIINAFYLWRKYHEKGSHKEFRLLVIKEILAKYNIDSVSSFSTSSVQDSNTLDHQLILSPLDGRCYVCWDQKGQRCSTRFKCLSCNRYVCASLCYDIHRKSE